MVLLLEAIHATYYHLDENSIGGNGFKVFYTILAI